MKTYSAAENKIAHHSLLTMKNVCVPAESKPMDENVGERKTEQRECCLRLPLPLLLLMKNKVNNLTLGYFHNETHFTHRSTCIAASERARPRFYHHLERSNKMGLYSLHSHVYSLLLSCFSSDRGKCVCVCVQKQQQKKTTKIKVARIYSNNNNGLKTILNEKAMKLRNR